MYIDTNRILINKTMNKQIILEKILIGIANIQLHLTSDTHIATIDIQSIYGLVLVHPVIPIMSNTQS